MKYHLAIDIGASSGRHILGHMENGKIVLEEVFRFDNRQKYQNGHDCWDVESLWKNILMGMRACKEAEKIPATVGIDSWAVDFVLIGRDGKRIGDAVSYRDNRTQGMEQAVEEVIPAQQLYERTGIQRQPFNTIYQLMALKREHPEQLEQAQRLLMLPDYFHFLLTGCMVNEYTNATSTGLVEARTHDWDREILKKLKFPEHLFYPLSMPGMQVGKLTQEVEREVGFSCVVVLPATHDTASAFLAVPKKEDAVSISSGTWSLLGVENAEPITTEKSRLLNFTNEGGYEFRFRYLRNIMGLWMIQSIRRELNGISYVEGKSARAGSGRKWSYAQLEQAAQEESNFPSLIDVNEDRFFAPESMVQAVKEACRDSEQTVPENIGQVMQCVYRSLAACYAETVRKLSELTGKTYRAIHIVGGGSKDCYLNRLTAQASGLSVYAGPSEATALGNLIVQMIADEELHSLEEARGKVRESFAVKEILP